MEGLHHEGLGDEGPVGQAEGNVADTQHGIQAHIVANDAQSLEGFGSLLLLGRHGQGQTVDPQILIRDADLIGRSLDTPGNGDALLSGGGQAFFVHAQAHHGSAVFLHNGQHCSQGFLRAVDRVDGGLTVVYPEGCFQCGGVGGIQLQGQRHNALQLLDHLGQQRHFIHAWHAHIHIQNVRASVHLLHRQRGHIVQILLQQGLLEPLFAGGIDALADDPHPVDGDCPGGCADKAGLFSTAAGRLTARQRIPQGAQVVGTGAAAAAQQGGPGIHTIQHGLRVLGRGQVIAAVHGIGQACVGLGNDGQRGMLGQFPDKGRSLYRAQRAVDADGIRAETFQRMGHGSQRAAGKGAAGGFKAHGHQHGQLGVLLDGQQGSLGLVQVGHGLDHRQISPGSGSCLGHLGKKSVGLLEGQATHGLQQLAQRPDIQRHQCISACRGSLGQLDCRRNHVLGAQAGGGQLVGVGPEGVGVDDAAAGFHIGAVDGRHRLASGQVHFLGLHAGFQSVLLEQGAHGAVQLDQALIKANHNVFRPF